MATASTKHDISAGLEQLRSQEPLDHRSEVHVPTANSSRESNVPPSLMRTATIGPVLQDQDNAPNLLLMGVNLNYYQPLYIAALKGDWETGRRFIERDPAALTARITLLHMTALHVAACAGQTQFAKKLVELMPAEALAMIDGGNYTALHYAAMGGDKRFAEALVIKNHALTQVTDQNGNVPLYTAAFASPESKELVQYLSMVTTDEHPSRPFTGSLAGQFICFLTHGGFHDISLHLLHRYPNLVTAKNPDGLNFLNVLALEPSNFLSGSRLTFWERWIYHVVPVEVNYSLRENPQHPVQSMNYIAKVVQWFKWLLLKAFDKLVPGIKKVRNAKLKHKYALELVKHVCIHFSCMDNQQILEYFVGQAILTMATFSGTIEIVRECLQFFPDLIWIPINKQTLMQVAVQNRQEQIFNLLYERTPLNKTQAYYCTGSETSVLHLAAKLAPYPKLTNVSGAALQMQREVQWFRAVEGILHPAFAELRMDGRTAWHMFLDEHKKLLEDGEKWMKDTSNSCMLVATLITTVVFAAAFTVPGGNISDKGIPIFLNKTSFMVFAISDALALFSSAMSILMFLSILTSRYAAEDFLMSLPKRMIIGLASLFLAIVTMMVAFGATLSIVLSEKLKWVSIPVTLLASVPVTTFAMLQLPLFVQMVQSSYGSGIFRPQKIW